MDSAAVGRGGGAGFPGGRYGAAPPSAGYPGPYPGYGDAGDDLMHSHTPPRPTNFHTRSLCLLVALPAAIFFVVSLVFALEYHTRSWLCWSLVVFFVCLSGLFMLAKQKNGAPKFWFNVGCLCLLATGVANFGGWWNYGRNFSLYWAYGEQRVYNDVKTSDPSLNYLDAGQLHFVQGTKLDPSLSVGIASGPDRYCVAPIVGPSADAASPKREVDYWAAGVNCCSREGNFTCDGALETSARSGLVFLDYGPRRAELLKYQKAARAAAGTHGIQVSQDAVFMAWVASPATAQQKYWHSGMMFVIGVSLVYLVFSFIVGVGLHFGPRPRTAKQKL